MSSLALVKCACAVSVVVMLSDVRISGGDAGGESNKPISSKLNVTEVES
jgi:hypothetical protein